MQQRGLFVQQVFMQYPLCLSGNNVRYTLNLFNVVCEHTALL